MKTAIKTRFLKSLLLFLSLFSLIFLPACKNDDSDEATPPSNNYEYRKLNVAVVLPLAEGSLQEKRFRRIAEWFSSNFSVVTIGMNFVINLEWYNEDELDFTSKTGNKSAYKLADSLANREDLLAVIGPLYSSHLSVFAERCFEPKKPLIAPCASSENLIRSYAVNAAATKRGKKKPFLWSLTETDISQIEALVSKGVAYKGKKVSLISSADVYGRTFFEWISFIATEYGIELVQNVRYASENTGAVYEAGTPVLPLDSALQTVFSKKADFIICALSNHKDVESVLEARKNLLQDSSTQLFFTNTAFTDEILNYGNLVEGIEGTSPYAAPESGFYNEYKARFNDETPVFGEAHFYDSLLLAGFAAAKCIKNAGTSTEPFKNETVNEALKNLNGSLEGGINSWTPVGMLYALDNITSNKEININGATGAIDFDSETYTSVLRTVYVHWAVVDGKFVNLDYTSTEEGAGSHTSYTRANWTWNLFADETELEKSRTANIEYAPIESQWAVLIAASVDWANYRHQSDILFIYQMLKKNGFPDDHIILILEDDIANTNKNSKKGNIYARLDGENLYTEDIQIDYLLTELTPQAVSDIMCGKKPELNRSSEVFEKHPKLVAEPTVLDTDEHSNILWFWSGHGTNRSGKSTLGYFLWVNEKQKEHFSTELMKTTLQTMKEQGRFRQLLIAAETCYSASVMSSAVEGIEGVLVFTAANGIEASLADLFDTKLGVWLTDRFTRNFTDYIIENVDRPYSDLYKDIASRTIGSHVCLFNAEKFGNLYQNTPKPFFVYAF